MPHLMPILPPNGSAGHPVAPVFRRLVVMDDDAAAHDGGLAAQGQVGVGEEGPGGGQVPGPAGHCQQGVFVLEVAHLTAPYTGV